MTKKVLNLLKKIGRAYMKGAAEMYGQMYNCRY